MDAGTALLRSLSVPVVQAPMAGGVSTPALAAAVASAGGLGSLGFAYRSPEQIATDLQASRGLSAGALNANFFVFEREPCVARGLPPHAEKARRALEAITAESGLAATAPVMPRCPWTPDLAAQLEPVWDLRPQVVSFHFGLPESWVIQRARDLGLVVAITATSPEEARLIEAAGAHLVVAQGIEAGGHRGRFNGSTQDDARLPTIELVRKVRAQVSLPVIAAGGVMDGADIKRMREAGAAAVQMGTAFLCAVESGASAAHRRLCADGGERGTELTAAFSGRPARGIRNRFIERMRGQPVLPFPLQNTMTGALRAAALAADDPEYQSLWAGTGYIKAKAAHASEILLAASVG